MADGSRTSDYDYKLPPDLIAQRPAERRDSSRLMVVDRAAGKIEHRIFSDLPEFLSPGDTVVVNSSKVMRARLLGTRSSGAPAEVMLLRHLGARRYEAMVHPGGKLKPGRMIKVSPQLSVEILETTESRTRIVELHTELDPAEAIESFGHIPLPPYIARSDEPADAERYQTVYARESGSVAAPTAGLHFTPGLMARIKSAGVDIAEVTLHVGAGTFRPVDSDDPAEHQMHEEVFSFSTHAAQALNSARDRGGRIVAVGTTAVRTLETCVDEERRFAPASGETRIFLRPPYAFKGVDRLVTNFHLPRSTLLMLVAAFAGYDVVMAAYREAIAERYRFYSYGDAMLII